MRIVLRVSGMLLTTLCLAAVHAQTYSPVPVTGFNHDVFAESPANTLLVTDTVLDATNHIMYTQAFGGSTFIGGGVPTNGLITDGSGTRQFQLAPFTGSNALTLMKGVSRPLQLVTPTSYSRLTVLAFSTEGASNISVTVRFTDGSSTNYINGYSLPDWFNATTNVVTSGFGRISRVAAAPYGVDGLPSNPRFYYIDVALNCADQLKTVSALNFANNSTTGTGAYPNAVFLALSGASFTQTINTSATPASCSASNGSGTVTVTGNTGPYTVTWPTLTPIVVNPTATNLAAGAYAVVVTNGFGCASPATVTVPAGGSPVTVSASATPATICAGATTQLSVSATGGTLSSATWTPGGATGNTVAVSPATNTTYTVNGSDQYGCAYSKQVSVTVNPLPAAPSVSGAAVCPGGSATLSVGLPAAGHTYNWYIASGSGTAAGTGTGFTTPALSADATYYVEAVSAEGCVQPVRTPVTVTVNLQPAVPSAGDVQVCSGSTATLSVQNPVAGVTYSWYGAPSGGALLANGATYQAGTPASSTTYYVEAASGAGCVSAGRGAVNVTVNPIPAVPQTIGSTICAGSIGGVNVFNPVPDVTYSWYATPTGGTVLSNALPYVSGPVNSTTTYYLEVVSNAGCKQDTRGAATITVNPLPAAPSGTAAAICTGNPAQLQTQNPVAGMTYNWYAAATGGTPVGSGLTYTTAALGAGATFYLEAVSAEGCISATRSAVPVAVQPAPAAPNLAAVAICPGSSVTLTIASPVSGNIYTWYAAPSGGSALFTGNTYQTPSLASATTFYISVTSSQGCPSSGRGAAPVTLRAPLRAPVPVVSALTSASVTFGWDAVGSATAYEVSTDGGATWSTPSSGSTGTSHMVSGLLPGATVTLQVRALGAQACERSAASAPVTAIVPDKNLFVPNVFTPNGDGRNDVLLVFSNSISSMNFRIYNQWGNEVFSSTEHRKGWDGTWNGQPQPVGVYVYVLRVQLFDGTELTKKGSISLVR